jgi:hypothetical protein
VSRSEHRFVFASFVTLCGNSIHLIQNALPPIYLTHFATDRYQSVEKGV